MPLAPGTKLGPYEILAPLGAGGTGELYRARDTRLGCAGAIKILPPLVSEDAERLNRFANEASVLSTLNHPNLLAICDVGAQNGIHFIVSELLEGKSKIAIRGTQKNHEVAVDARGKFEIPAIPPGRYTIVLESNETVNIRPPHLPTTLTSQTKLAPD